MPKNKGKGGKNRRRGKNENESEKRELVFKEDEQEYAQVTKMLGNGRLEAMCFDGVKRLCHIRGKLRKKVSESSLFPSFFQLMPATTMFFSPHDFRINKFSRNFVTLRKLNASYSCAFLMPNCLLIKTS
jgi:hypothetical protein